MKMSFYGYTYIFACILQSIHFSIFVLQSSLNKENCPLKFTRWVWCENLHLFFYEALKPIFHQKTGWRRVEFASPTQKSSLKSTWPTPGRTQNCRREVYSPGLALGKFRVTSAGVGVWRWIENEADLIQDGGGRTQTTRVGHHYDASGRLF